jgi:hypothetical protein
MRLAWINGVPSDSSVGSVTKAGGEDAFPEWTVVGVPLSYFDRAGRSSSSGANDRAMGRDTPARSPRPEPL